jgi:hypothetical protein
LDGQFEQFSREQPGLKAVRVAESAKFRFVAARRPSLFHFRPTKVLVFPRQDAASFELPLAECELEPTTWTLVKQARSAS